MCLACDYLLLGGRLSSAEFLNLPENFQLELLAILREEKGAEPHKKVTKDSPLAEKIAFARLEFDTNIEKSWTVVADIFSRISTAKEEVCAVKFDKFEYTLLDMDLRLIIRQSCFSSAIIEMAYFSGHLVISFDLKKLAEVKHDHSIEKAIYSAHFGSGREFLEKYFSAAENSLVANHCLLPDVYSFVFTRQKFAKKCLKAAEFTTKRLRTTDRSRIKYCLLCW